MKIIEALEIGKREWRNIRVSLEKFGDIGEFDSRNYSESDLNLYFEYSPLVSNLIEMENKLPAEGYYTQEAAYVFTTFGWKAGERLGLKSRLAQTFGRGYSWVRTGRFDPYGIEKHQAIKQLFFMKIFFPLGGYYNWNFDSLEVKTKLNAILHMFSRWQDNPRVYIEDVRRFKDQLEPLWNGLSLHVNFPVPDRKESF